MEGRGMQLGFWWESQKERDHLEDLDVAGCIMDNIRKDLRETGWGGMDWINLAEDRDQLRAFVKKVRNLRVP
jgi:hypothetical protein